jgi:hypothetical protein
MVMQTTNEIIQITANDVGLYSFETDITITTLDYDLFLVTPDPTRNINIEKFFLSGSSLKTSDNVQVSQSSITNATRIDVRLTPSQILNAANDNYYAVIIELNKLLTITKDQLKQVIVFQIRNFVD